MNGSMASACATSSSPLVSPPSACPSSKKAAAAIFRRRRRRTVSCRATGGGGDNDGLLWLPRRDMMLNGLGGVAAGLAWYPGLASADDAAKDPPQCTRADKVDDSALQCFNDKEEKPCPLETGEPIGNFEPAGCTRVRQAVHLLTAEHQEKYKEAVAKMKALPEDNPLCFKAQAAIHQAYCDSYYKYGKSSGSAAASNDPVFDVHFSWIFAPWHRMYIYFYEKALGDLIGDDTFALPFWNWDVHDGMVLPSLFKDKKWNKDGTKVKLKNLAGKEFEVDDNPLYDCNRNGAHLDNLMDLQDYKSPADTLDFVDPKDKDKYRELLNKNYCAIYYQQQVKIDKRPEFYLGEKYCTGMKKGSGGLLESSAHTCVHVWVGKKSPKGGCTSADGVMDHTNPGQYNCRNDMGFLGSAANDPLFYSHHSNVDRMWHLWSTSGGQGFADEEWLDTSFVFWDNVKKPRKVRVKVRDVLDTTKLGYKYAGSGPLPWLDCKPTSLNDGKTTVQSLVMAAKSLVQLAPTKEEEEQQFPPPVDLVENQPEEVAVTVPEKKKKGDEQVLVIDGIEYDPQRNNKFDVGINVPAGKALQVGPQYKQYAGSFSVVPGSGGGATQQGKLSLCITGVLADVKPDKDSTVRVVIVPRTEAKVTLNVRPTIEIRNYS